MDLGKWFRNIEHLIGILNGINDKIEATKLTNSLIRTSHVFKAMTEYYLSQCESYDIEVMLNRISIIIDNLNIRIEQNEILSTNNNVFINITFFELEKWKQGIMNKVGILFSMSDNLVKKMFRKEILTSIKVLSMYTISYLIHLNKIEIKQESSIEKRKIHDLNILINQLINIVKGLKQMKIN